MSDEPLLTWEKVFGKPKRGIWVIIDSQLAKSYGQLRSLPLVRKLGIEKFTFVNNWKRSFSLTPFEFVLVHQDTQPEELISHFPICQLVSQKIEQNSLSDVTQKLLMAYKGRADNALLVFVLDSQSFQLKGSTGTKSFIDEYKIKNVVSYPGLFQRCCTLLGHTDPIIRGERSFNLVLHEIGWRSENLGRIDRLSELIERSMNDPESPVWDWLLHFMKMKNVVEDDNVLREQLHPWIDTDITSFLRKIMDVLQRFNFDPQKLLYERDRLEINLI